MIDHHTLRRIAAERKIELRFIEKDYCLGWILKGISGCSVSDRLVFKGGTSLSKVYYPLDWRISEDLDFTAIGSIKMNDIFSAIQSELQSLVEDASGGIKISINDNPLLHDDFLRVYVSVTGPITQHKVKIEITREKVLGNYHLKNVAVAYDYPVFSLLVYAIDNILAEKLRSLIERTKIRDYYDVWRLLRMELVDAELLRENFYEKCRGKGIDFKNVAQFFPEDLIKTLSPFLEDLTRMNSDPLPALEEIIKETRKSLENIFSD